jgi:arylsulfatase
VDFQSVSRVINYSYTERADTLKSDFQIVPRPGPDVLVVHTAIADGRGLMPFVNVATSVVSARRHQVPMEFKYDAGGVAKGRKVTLFYDGKNVGEGRVDATQPFIFSADETADDGRETGSTVTTHYNRKTSVFNGTINWVLDLEGDDHDHLISPQERLSIAMMRQ